MSLSKMSQKQAARVQTTQRINSLHHASLTTLSIALTHLRRAIHRFRALMDTPAALFQHPNAVTRRIRHTAMIRCLDSAVKELEKHHSYEQRRRDDFLALGVDSSESEVELLGQAIADVELGLGMAVSSTVESYWTKERGWVEGGKYEWWPAVEGVKDEWKRLLVEERKDSGVPPVKNMEEAERVQLWLEGMESSPTSSVGVGPTDSSDDWPWDEE